MFAVVLSVEERSLKRAVAARYSENVHVSNTTRAYFVPLNMLLLVISNLSFELLITHFITLKFGIVNFLQY